MSRAAAWLLFIVCAMSHKIAADESVQNTTTKSVTAPFQAFTGKILKNKVRMRLHPDMDSPVIRDFHADDLVIVVGDTGDFYAVEPPSDMKAYIFRTYVLDGVIEGKHVNIRLEPDLNAPVIAQLNSGDSVVGIISPRDKKWLEINPPASTRFYIAKDFIQNIGDPSLLSKRKARHEELMSLLAEVRIEGQSELQKGEHEANLEDVVHQLNHIIASFSDFPNEIAQAKELLNQIQTAYFNMKVAHIESAGPANSNISPSNIGSVKRNVTSKMASWLAVEQVQYENWLKDNPNHSMDSFYRHQQADAKTLRGIIEPFARNIKNRPGDYVLKSSGSRTPIGYLYSTQIDLDEYVGQEVTVKAVQRNNQHFVHDAYYVLSVE